MYDLQIKEEADKIFQKLARKKFHQLEMINKKVSEICSNPEHIYKFLHNPLQGFNRVHIDTNFVLIFKIDHAKKTVVLYYYAHHDEIYKWRPREE